MRRHCFLVPHRIRLPRHLAFPFNESPAAEPLAHLLPLLGCGEEAAAVAFDDLAERHDPVEAAALTLIAEEERVHDALIDRLLDGLPAVAPRPALLAEARRFHTSLACGGSSLHLARIAALDAAVCTILGALLRSGRPIEADPATSSVLRRIRADETKHVRIARRMSGRQTVTAVLRDAAAETRERMAAILRPIGDAFEALGVDPDWLDGRLRRLPNDLLAR